MRRIGPSGVAVLVLAVGGCVAPSPSGEPAQSPPVDMGFSANGIARDRAALLAQRAMDDAWVRDQLAGHRSRVIEITNPGDQKSGVLVWIFDYDALQSVVVEFSLDNDEIVDRQLTEGQPNISASETEEASALALADPEVLRLTFGHEIRVAATAGVTRGACARSRCLAVFVSTRSGDRPFILVTVDLVDRAVISVRETE